MKRILIFTLCTGILTILDSNAALHTQELKKFFLNQYVRMFGVTRKLFHNDSTFKLPCNCNPQNCKAIKITTQKNLGNETHTQTNFFCTKLPEKEIKAGATLKTTIESNYEREQQEFVKKLENVKNGTDTFIHQTKNGNGY